MIDDTTKNAKRSVPRYNLHIDPVVLKKHWRDIEDFALHADTDEPLDMVYEFATGTTTLTGKVQFIHPGHSQLVAGFIKTLNA